MSKLNHFLANVLVLISTETLISDISTRKPTQFDINFSIELTGEVQVWVGFWSALSGFFVKPTYTVNDGAREP